MNITDMIDELQAKLDIETKQVAEQEIVVTDLCDRYAQQLAILRAMKTNVNALVSSITELRKAQKSKTYKDARTAEDDAVKLDQLLNEAADIAISKGIIQDPVPSKQGGALSMRKSIINRARNALTRYCPNNVTTINFLSNMSDDEIFKLRNVGHKSAYLIKVAQRIVNGRPVEENIK